VGRFLQEVKLLWHRIAYLCWKCPYTWYSASS